tara:strand:+ start:88 stop:318 length:231 start_codon:yes stop_codon:yes gene_type:complete
MKSTLGAFYYKLDDNNVEQIPVNVAWYYRSERTLLKYGIPRTGRWSVHIHRDFDNTLYQDADKVLHVEDGKVTHEA